MAHKYTFPKDFKWGAATAAFQIEGHPEEYAKKLSDWSHWIDKEDKVAKPTNDGKAVDHWSHLEEDIELIKKLNSNVYRFSFNWAAIHRGPGQFDQETIDFYKRLLDGLETAGVEPFATLVHFVLPQWLSEKGGWENPETAYEFEKFTAYLVEQFGDKIKNWITLNEPNIFLWFGYESGIWPPGYQNDWNRYLQAFQGLLLGHQLSYKAIKAKYPESQVGFGQNLFAFQSFANDGDKIPLLVREKLHNLAFIETCVDMGCMDFLGVNYYTRLQYELNPKAKDLADENLESLVWGQSKDPQSIAKATNQKLDVNSLNWEVYPEGLHQLLTDKKIKRIIGDMPIYITENGYCHVEEEGHSNEAGYSTLKSADQAAAAPGSKDLDDNHRIEFIQEHLKAVYKAIHDGVNVKGYFYWSLLDNFEWALGMRPRFGLVHVDHSSFQRTPKASFDYYANVIKNNCL